MKRLKKGRSIKKAFFDLNHPADFHFFKHLMNWMIEQGYVLKIVARDKECLHILLEDAGFSYTSRGSGLHSLPGKYLYAFWVLTLLFIKLVRFRPNVCLGLSSPYLAVVSRLLKIKCVSYDDTDDNPRLLPLIKQSSYLLSPGNYPHKFHSYHFRLPSLKELAYLHPAHFQHKQEQQTVFFRITRTDSIHHSTDSVLDEKQVFRKMQELSVNQNILLSSELDLKLEKRHYIQPANPVRIHKDLANSKVFWSNSATMAAEAAVLGVPAIFVSAEKFAYISELEEYGLLYYYHPDNLVPSLEKIDSILAGNPSSNYFRDARERLLRDKMDMTAFLIWFIDQLPDSARIIEKDINYARRFIMDLL